MAIKPIVESMILKANETTGKSDANLTNAMQSLINGYGQGGESGSIVKSKETTNFTIISGYSNLSVKYSSSVVDNNGELALGGTTNSVSVSTASDLDVIKGKYIEKSSSDATAIYYIPEDTTITQTGSTYSKSYVASKANQMFVLG